VELVASAPSGGIPGEVGGSTAEEVGVAVVDVVTAAGEEDTVGDIDVGVAESVVVVVVGARVEIVVEVAGESFPDREAPIASVHVLTSSTTSCPCASLTGVKTKTHVTVTGPNGVSVV